MTTPSLPAFFDMQCTQKGDMFSADFYLYLDQQFQVLNDTITLYGVTVPSFTTAQVAAFPTNVTVGTVWYNSTLDKLQFQGASAVQTITST
jgi:hypothetical protein